MEKRLILAVAVSIVILTVYNSLFLTTNKPAINNINSQNDTAAFSTLSAPVKKEVAVGDITLSGRDSFSNSKDSPEYSIPDTNLIPNPVEKSYTIKNNKINIEFTNAGASIKNIYITGFNNLSTGKQLNLLNDTSCISRVNPLTVDIDQSGELSEVVFNTVDYSETHIVFEYKTDAYYYGRGILRKSLLPPGLRLIKRFDLSPQDNTAKLSIKIIKPVDLNMPALNLIKVKKAETNDEYTGGISIDWTSGIISENKVQNSFMHLPAGSLKKELPETGNKQDDGLYGTETKNIFKKIISVSESKWIGLSTNYFLIALTLEGVKSNIAVLYSDNLNIGFKYISAPLSFKDNAIDLNFNLFLGPKDYNLLEKQFPDLKMEESMEYGWFNALALILLKVLKFFYKIIPNYGVSIILLTILINVLLYPLKAKSFKAMEDMKVMQPKIEELKTKYADDKVKIQQETMKLYKEHKINPIGGCLPMFLQLPIFMGLYRMLQYAIELRGAPFLYISDLSAPDTIYVLPIIMGITMFIQQKFTPAPPEQQKIFMFLPIIFTFMFRSMPAGLILYWTAFNVISIVQQLYQTKFSKRKR